jgi:phosphonate transport system ATP-binding protein
MPNTNNPILSIRNLVKTYPNGTQALKGVSFDVKRGEFLVVIGLSGSGKSTMLRCVNRLHHPTSGQIIYRAKDGKETDIAQAQGDEILKIRRTMGMIFQHFNLIPRHSVLQNVLYGSLGATPTLSSMLGLFAESDEKRAMEYLRLVGISDKAQFRAAQLSGGMNLLHR